MQMSWIATTFWKCYCKVGVVIGGTTEAVQRLLTEINLATNCLMLLA
jgi:hypothetical protein